VNTPPNANAVALRGKNLVVATKSRQLVLYDAQTGALRKAFTARGNKHPHLPGVQGNIAIYSVGSDVHAVNLSSGKDRVVAQLNSAIDLAQIDSAGLAYAGNGIGKTYGKATLGFLPLARLRAAVG